MAEEIKLSKEIRDEIYARIEYHYKNTFEEMGSFYIETKEIADNILNIQNKIHKKLDEMQNIVQGHAKGVQNVYDLFGKLTDENFINNFDRKIKEFKEEFIKIRKDVNKNEEFVKGGLRSIAAVKDLYKLSKSNPELIKRIVKVIELLKEEDDI